MSGNGAFEQQRAFGVIVHSDRSASAECGEHRAGARFVPRPRNDLYDDRPIVALAKNQNGCFSLSCTVDVDPPRANTRGNTAVIAYLFPPEVLRSERSEPTARGQIR